MSALLTNIGTILTSLLNWFGQIGSYLITNPIFIIILSVGIFSLLFYRLKIMVNHLKWHKKYEEDDNKLREEEYNSFLDNTM